MRVKKVASLKEMPYINVKGKDIFDLEIEKFKSHEDFISYLEDIISGKPQIDKNGNEINLKSRSDKIKFIRSLKSDYFFNSYVEYKLNDYEKRLVNLILNI